MGGWGDNLLMACLRYAVKCLVRRMVVWNKAYKYAFVSIDAVAWKIPCYFSGSSKDLQHHCSTFHKSLRIVDAESFCAAYI